MLGWWFAACAWQMASNVSGLRCGLLVSFCVAMLLHVTTVLSGYVRRQFSWASVLVVVYLRR